MNTANFSKILHIHIGAFVLGCSLLLAGCGPARLGFGDEPTPTPTWEPVATFTSTPLPLTAPTDASIPTPLPATAEPVALPAPTVLTVMTITEMLTTSETVITEVVNDAAVVDLVPTSTPELLPVAQPTSAQLTVLVDAANVRDGPGTDYSQMGVVTRDAIYPVTGRNEQGDWWQFCCVNDLPGWLFSALVAVQNSELVAVVAAPPPPIPPTVEPVAQIAPEQAPATVESVPLAAESAPAEEAAPVAIGPSEHSGTAGNIDPNAQFDIVHYRVLGFADNNGGIFNKGGQHHIFITVLDQNGNGVDGAVLKDAVDDKLNIVTGSKGPGKAEIEMYWDRYKLYVAADPSGAATSQISNQMNTAYPHIPDIIGLLGPVENEYAICPTADDRCTPPFYHAHWSYEITFQKVR